MIFVYCTVYGGSGSEEDAVDDLEVEDSAHSVGTDRGRD